MYTYITKDKVGAVTDVVYLYPDADSYGNVGRWVVGGSGCAQLFCRINQYPGTDTSYIEHQTTTNAADVQYFTMSNPAYIGQGIISFALQFYAASANYSDGSDTAHDYMLSRAKYGMTNVNDGTDIFSPSGSYRTDTFSTGGYTYQLFEQSQLGSLTKAQIDDVQIGFNRQRVGTIFSSQLHRVRAARVQITYTKPPLWNQTDYRFYESSSAITPSSALTSTQNQPARLLSDGDTFRLRTGLVAGETAWGANFGNYKLQYALKTSTCSASTFMDVQTGSGDIRWYNAGPANGTVISSYAYDPGGTKTYQSYHDSNPFMNGSAVPVNNLALWDFSLKDHSNSPGNIYCFRIVKADQAMGYEAIDYTRYPEIQTVGSLGVGFVNNVQSTINPTIVFDTKYMLFQCQSSTSQTVAGGSLVRVTNDISENGWSASIAPTDGPSATWYDSESGNRIDFNDGSGSPAGCFSGSDGDTIAGQLTVNVGSLNIARHKSGCSTSGLSRGNTASFQEGSLDAINLYSASSSADMFCWWDIDNLTFTQQIPALTPPGSYELDMTLTVTAS